MLFLEKYPLFFSLYFILYLISNFEMKLMKIKINNNFHDS